MKRSRGDRSFDVVVTLVLVLVIIVTVYPFLHILAISLNDARDSAAGGIGIIPRKLSLDSYRAVFGFENIYASFGISASRTVLGTLLSLVITSMAAFVMTKNYLVFFKGFYRFFVISMFINGGLIPTFLLYQGLGLYNSFLVYILPYAFNVFYMILFRTYFIGIPREVEESAFMDGAGEMVIFVRIIFPLSLPIFATVGLFMAVRQWNQWQDTLFFTSDTKLETLQFVLMKVLRQAEAASMSKQARSLLQKTVSITPQSIKMSISIVATLPILIVYPFLQKFFVKGIMIGAVKG